MDIPPWNKDLPVSEIAVIQKKKFFKSMLKAKRLRK